MLLSPRPHRRRNCPPLRSPAGSLYARYGCEMIAAVDAVFAAGGLADRWAHPTLMVHGERDRICIVTGARRFFERIASRSSPATPSTTSTAAPSRLSVYGGGFHEIFNETTLPITTIAHTTASGVAGGGAAAGSGAAVATVTVVDSSTATTGDTVSRRCISDVVQWLSAASASTAAAGR